jgi:hypothetical protein
VAVIKTPEQIDMERYVKAAIDQERLEVITLDNLITLWNKYQEALALAEQVDLVIEDILGSGWNMLEWYLPSSMEDTVKDSFQAIMNQPFQNHSRGT